MKSLLLIVLSAILSIFPGKVAEEPTNHQQFENEWKKVESYRDKGLPRSALDVVDKIYRQAKEANNTPQFLKAVIYQQALRSEFDVDFNVKAISDIRKEIATPGDPVQKSILNSALGELYWNYYRQSRFQIADRSQVDVDEENPATWDIKTILQHARKHYLLSLENRKKTSATSLKSLNSILNDHKNTIELRPTAFDFVAYRALEFIQSNDYLLTEANLEIAYSKEDYFAPVKDYLKIDFAEDEPSVQALRIYQMLLKTHRDNASALAEANLKRLEHVKSKATFFNKEELYINALQKFAAEIKDSPEWSLAQYYIAEHTYNKKYSDADDTLEEKNAFAEKALQLCDEAIKAYPGSYGASLAEKLKNSILDKSLSITAENAVLPGKPFPVQISYKNFGDLSVNVYRINFDGPWNRQRMDRREKLDFLLKQKPVQSFSKKLTTKKRHIETTTEIAVPELGPGYYVVLVSSSGDFVPINETSAFAEFWVTNISFLNWEHGDNKLELTLLNRDDGKEIKRAKVRPMTRKYDYKNRKYEYTTEGVFESDRDGKVMLKEKEISSGSFYLDIRDDGDRYVSSSNFYLRDTKRRDKTKTKIYLFTDRVLYRPGQTVQFKGIVLNKNKEGSEIVSDYKTKVQLRDVNNKVVSDEKFTSNEFGTFSGSFVLPGETLNGSFQLRTQDGSTSFSVEEYRRPRFAISSEPLKGTYKLNETVYFKGKAEALAGYPVEGAEVEYKVTRKPEFPFYRGIFYQPGPEITLEAGTTTTNEEGAFEIPFVTEPDATIPRQQKPVFNYHINIKVTDRNGETHEKSANLVAGYDSFIPKIKVADEVNNRKTLSIEPQVHNLSGEKVLAEGVLRIEKLKDFDRLMKSRYWQKPDEPLYPKEEFTNLFPHLPYGDEDEISKLPVEKEMLSTGFYTADSLVTRDISGWEPGAYKITFEVSKNRETHKAEKWITVFDPEGKDIPLKQFGFFKVMRQEALPGEKARVLIGSGARRVEVHLRAEQNGKVFFEDILKIKDEQEAVEIPVTEKQRGNFSIHASFVMENRAYNFSETIKVPYNNKNLDLRLEVNKTPLMPGGKEEWTLHLSGPGSEAQATEILAGMYDASLDEIKAMTPWSISGLFPEYYGSNGWSNNQEFSQSGGMNFYVDQRKTPKVEPRTYPSLNWFGYRYMNINMRGVHAEKSGEVFMVMESEVPVTKQEGATASEELTMDIIVEDDAVMEEKMPAETPLRTHFDETAFFYPQLMSKGDSVTIKFTLPESLTEWKFMALAHTKDLKTGSLVKKFRARKELMVVPNPPRFARENDRFEFAAKVVNLSEEDQEVTVELQLFDARKNTMVTETLGLKNNQRKLTIPSGESRNVAFPMGMTMNAGLLKYRITAATASFSDGQEDYLPVLTNRKLLTETKAFSMNAAGTKTVEVPSFEVGNSERLTVEYTANAAWYAVQALPFLEDKNGKSAPSLANTIYANSLGRMVVGHNPEIEEVFRLWKEQDHEALLSNLEKNEELKNVVIEHTPWLLEAEDESEDKQRIAAFFDQNKLQYQKEHVLEKLAAQQNGDGGWSWHQGMPSSQYITQSVIMKLAELMELGALHGPEVDAIIRKGIEFCSAEVVERYDRLRKKDDFEPEEYRPTNTEVNYLFTLSMLEEAGLSAKAQKVADEYSKQMVKHRTEYNKYLQGMIGLTLFNEGRAEEAKNIVNSLREYALWDDDGMYWRFEGGWYWYQAPIDFQALMVQLFDKAGDFDEDVENLKLWLLKQKQTQKWPTASATAKAVYALLTTGKEMLSTDVSQLKIAVGNKTLDMDQAQSGTGYIKKSWDAAAVNASMSKVTVEKNDENVSWGAVYHQYFEELENIESHAEGVSVEKQLFVVRQTEEGGKLEKVSKENPAKVGDKLRIRLVMTSDKNLEFVHLEDGFATGFEVPGQLSGYHVQDGLMYYRLMRDASAGFFIQSMRKGTYVLEYDVIAEQAGDFSMGIATLQSLYAPEFAAHSDGMKISVGQ